VYACPGECGSSAAPTLKQSTQVIVAPPGHSAQSTRVSLEMSRAQYAHEGCATAPGGRRGIAVAAGGHGGGRPRDAAQVANAALLAVAGAAVDTCACTRGNLYCDVISNVAEFPNERLYSFTCLSFHPLWTLGQPTSHRYRSLIRAARPVAVSGGLHLSELDALFTFCYEQPPA
jgi:hypothetical protein